MKIVVASFLSSVILSVILFILLKYVQSSESDGAYVWFITLILGLMSFIYNLMFGLFAQFILQKLKLSHSFMAYLATGIIVAVVVSLFTVWVPIIIGQNEAGWNHYWITIVIFMASLISLVSFYMIIGSGSPDGES